MTPAVHALLAALDAYAPGDATEAAARERIRAYVRTTEEPFSRGTLVGHLTGSAWVTNATATAAALVHHRKLDRWVQPGGHAESGDADLAATAAREACEELGVAPDALVLVSPAIYDLDVHPIPAHREVPAHVHYDVRYRFTLADDVALAPSAESHAARWVPLNALAEPEIDSSVRRLARKTGSVE